MSNTRSRPRHAVSNDRLLLDAATVAFAEDGFDTTSMASISARADLSYGAAYARFGDKCELAGALWEEELFPPLQRALQEAAGAVSRGEDAFALAMAPFAGLEPWLLASMELLQASRFEPDLAEHISTPFSAWLAEWVLPAPNEALSAAVIRATTTYLGMGLPLAAGRPWQVDLTTELRRYARALATPAAPTDLPGDLARYLEQWPFHSGDPRLDRALESIAKTVGQVGYHRATIGLICKVAAVTPGFVYSRYANKRELFLAANEVLLNYGFGELATFTEQLATRYGSGIAEAVVWREFQRPEYAVKRSLALETNRLARFDVQMRGVQDAQELAIAQQIPQGAGHEAALAHLHTEIAMALGVHLVANLVPQVWTLPFDMVTVPLLASLEVSGSQR